MSPSSDVTPLSSTVHPFNNIDIEVYDNLKDVFLGRLHAITCEQLTIEGTQRLEEGKSFKLDIHLPDSLGEGRSIHLGADCRAQAPGEGDDGEVLITTFAICDLSPQAQEDVRWLLAVLDDSETLADTK